MFPVDAGCACCPEGVCLAVQSHQAEQAAMGCALWQRSHSPLGRAAAVQLLFSVDLHDTQMLLWQLAAQHCDLPASWSAGHDVGVLLCRDGMPSLFRLVHNNLQELVLEQCSDLYMGRRFFPSLAHLTNLKVIHCAVWLRTRAALNRWLLELDCSASHCSRSVQSCKSLFWPEASSSPFAGSLLPDDKGFSVQFPSAAHQLASPLHSPAHCCTDPTLQVLSLKNMRSTISDADFTALASLTQLQEVVLDCDQPPDTLEDPSANEVKWGLLHFPEAMMQLTNMTHLTLSCHYGITQLPTSISRLNKLQVRALQG